MPEVKKLTRGQKAWATRRANQAKKDAKIKQYPYGTDTVDPTKRKKEAEFKEVTSEERAREPRTDLLEVDDIMVLNMQDLVNYAEKMGIDTYTKPRADILVELGVTERKGGKIFVRPQPSAEKLRYLLERNYSIPMNTIFPEKEFDEWLKIVAEEPMAFNGADLADNKGEIVHTLHRKNKCACGATVNFDLHPDTGKPYPIMKCGGVPGTIKRKGRLIPVMKCISTDAFRKFIWHEVPEA